MRLNGILQAGSIDLNRGGGIVDWAVNFHIFLGTLKLLTPIKKCNKYVACNGNAE